MRRSTPPLFADRVELTIARREIEAGALELEAAIALEDKRERSEKVKVAVAHLALAARALDEICDRRQEPSASKPPTKGPRVKNQDKPRQRATDEARTGTQAEQPDLEQAPTTTTEARALGVGICGVSICRAQTFRCDDPNSRCDDPNSELEE